MFPEEVRLDLGLLTKNFKNVSQRTNYGETWRDICAGLSGLKNISITSNSKVVCTANFPLNRRLSIFLSGNSRKQLNEYLTNCTDNDLHLTILDGVSDILSDILVRFSFRESTLISISNQNWEALRDASLTVYSITPATPKEYCDWLFSNENHFYDDILQILAQCKDVFPARMYLEIAENLINKLVDKICEKECMLILPREKHNKFAVIPFFPKQPLTLASNEYYSHMNFVLSNMKVLFQHKFPKTYSESTLETLVLQNFDFLMQGGAVRETLERIFETLAEAMGFLV